MKSNSSTRKTQDSPQGIQPTYSPANNKNDAAPPGHNSSGKEGGSTKRKRTTIRIQPELWQKFMQDTHKKDLSTCHVLEALLGAWLYGGSVAPGIGQPITLNLTMQHVVERPRRQEPMPKKGKRETEFHDRYGRPKNRYDPFKGWYHDPDLDPGMIVVELPRQWKGEDKGFTWSAGRGAWWKQEKRG